MKDLTSETLELKQLTICNNTHIIESDIFTRYSSFSKLQNEVAYCLRFKYNTQHRQNRHERSLSAAELNNALTTLVRIAQENAFAEEILEIRKNGYVSPRNSLASLTPFLDKDNILRVGSRLRNAAFPYAQKHPMLLPKNHTLTLLIMRHQHVKQLHAGPQALLANLRQKFWPIEAKNTIRRIIHECIRCAKVKPQDIRHIMGNLPATRVTQARPLLDSGIEYCGPFYLKGYRSRSKFKIKTYVAVFICFVTRAIHLELVTNLTTEAFIGSLRRFIARRGKCLKIYSDNATNFTGAKNELKELVF